MTPTPPAAGLPTAVGWLPLIAGLLLWWSVLGARQNFTRGSEGLVAWLEFTAAVGIAAAVVVGFGLAVARRGPAPVAGWLAVVAGGGVAVRAGLILAGWRL